MGGSRARRRRGVDWSGTKRRRVKKAPIHSAANTVKQTPIIETADIYETTLLNGKRTAREESNLNKRKRITSFEVSDEEINVEDHQPRTGTIPSTSSLKIKKEAFLNLLNKLTPSDKIQKKSSMTPLPSANDLPVPRCNRISRPVFLGDWSSSDEDEEEKKMLNGILPPLPIVVKVEKEALNSASDFLPLPGKSVETSSINNDVRKSLPAVSTRKRKSKPRPRFTRKKRKTNAAQGAKKSLPKTSMPVRQSVSDEIGLSDSLLFDEVEMPEVRLCLQRVDEQDEFQDLFRKMNEKSDIGKGTEMDLFGSDSDVTDKESDSSNENERTTSKHLLPLPNSKPQSCRCSVCDSIFEDEFALDEHMKQDHNDQLITSKPIKCRYCSRFFTNQRMLVAHEALHANKTKIVIDRPKAEKKHYICHLCNKRYKTGSGLIGHMGLRHPKAIAPAERKNYVLRKRKAISKNHSLTRREAIPNLRYAIQKGIIPPAQSIYVNQDGAISFGNVKQERNLEVPIVVVEEQEDEDFLHTNGTMEKIKNQTMAPVIMKFDETEFVDDEAEEISTTDSLMVRRDLSEVGFKEGDLANQMKKVVSLDLADGIQCDISDMGSLLDLLDGPDPHVGVPGYPCETLTLNYERNDEGQGIFKCDYCPKILSSKSFLQIHCRQSHFARIRKPYICLHPNCSQRFDSSQNLQIHRNKVHSRKEDVSEAPLLPEKESEVATGVQVGDESNEDSEAYQNTVASSDFATTDACDETTEVSTQQSGVQQEPAIPSTSASRTTIAERNEDLLKGYKYKCKVCGVKFKKLSAFVKHEWEHSENGSKSQCCPYCPRRFTDRTSYILHTKCHMSAQAAQEGNSTEKVMGINRIASAARSQRKGLESTPLPCQHCDLVFSSVSSYISHINDAHCNLTDVFKYQCPHLQCTKSNFKHPWNFRVHVASHLINPQCNLCGATFSCSTNLRKHKKAKHPNSKWTEIVSQTRLQYNPRKRVKKNFQYCTACMKKVDCTSELHICAEVNQAEFPCQLCGKTFTTREDLKDHITFHAKQQCRICSQSVYVLRMDQHLESHLGETSFDCKVCRRPYNCRDSLVKHLRSKAHARTLERVRRGSRTLQEGDASSVEVNGEVNEEEHENSRSIGIPETEEVEVLFPNFTEDYSSESESGNTVDPLAAASNRRHSMESQRSNQSHTSSHARVSSAEVDQTNGKGWMKTLLSKYTTQTDNSKDKCGTSTNSASQVNALRNSQYLEEHNPGSVESPQSHMSISEDSGHSQSNMSSRITLSSSSGTTATVGKDDHSEICQICQEICHGIFGLGNHMFRVHNLFRCSACHLCSVTSHEHDLHIRTAHSESKFYCKACKKLFLSEHYMARHEEGELHKLRVLQMENDALADILEIRSEELDKDPEIESPQQLYNCEICSEIYQTIQKLEFHILHLHEQFLCNICLKLFGSRKGLENHRRCHVGESKYDCLICMSPFRKLAALNSHKKSRSHLAREKEVDQPKGETPIQIAISEPLGAERDPQQSNEPTVFMVSDLSEGDEGHENMNQSDETTVGTTIFPLLITQQHDVDMNELRKNKLGFYECCLCQTEFREFELFDEHMLAGHDVALFKKVSSRIHKLFRSLNQTPQIFKCTACKKIFLDNIVFKKHWVKFHCSFGEKGNVEASADKTQPNKQMTQLLESTSTHVRGTYIPTFFACANCDNLFQNQVDLNIHAVECVSSRESFEGTIRISQIETTSPTQKYLTITGLPSTGQHAPQVIDLTEEEDEAAEGNPPSNCDSNSGNSNYRDVKGVLTEDLLQSEQPIIQHVYSLQGVPR